MSASEETAIDKVTKELKDTRARELSSNSGVEKRKRVLLRTFVSAFNTKKRLEARGNIVLA